MCPVTVLLGYAMFVGLGRHEAGHVSAPMVEAQVCQDGIGAYANATTNGLYAGGVQYGFTTDQGPVAFRLTPRLGVSHADHPVHALPSHTQFDLELVASVQYGRYLSQIGYSHWSRGCALSLPCNDYEYQHNHGLDRIALMAGIVF
jgi:hypothetical protein